MNNGKTPGDGKTTPFGTNGGPMAGNDFLKNPAGSQPGTRGNDFVTSPAGAGPSAPTPPDFTKGSASPQKTGPAPDLNPESEVKGKDGLLPDATVPQGSPRAPLIGVGSIGDTRKPFKGF